MARSPRLTLATEEPAEIKMCSTPHRHFFFTFFSSYGSLAAVGK